MTSDSLQILQLEQKYAAMDSIINSQQQTIILLNEKVQKFEIAEGYFQSILASQLGTFSIIIAVITAILGLVTWTTYKSYFKKKIFKVRNELIERNDRNMKLIKKAMGQIDFLHIAAAQTQVALALKNEDFPMVVYFKLHVCTLDNNFITIEKINDDILRCVAFTKKIKSINKSVVSIDEINNMIQKISEIKGVNSEKLNLLRQSYNEKYYQLKTN